MPDRVVSRRYVARSDAALILTEIIHARVEETATGARLYDVVRDGWHEAVLVPDDDPLAGTVEQFDV